ncbi:MAG: arsenic resistance N-acetyltransferase ArsN2 [Candidatus Kapabacteria bacterium]|jgi:amino-acid N-acetyltransferase|nr:arsenic resistance N-acetyltransferase ArsN2 [Candidatus Kapabacteria bacterium]
MVLGFAQEHDEASIHRLLNEATLPTNDLTTQHLHHFVVMREGEEILGVAGVEQIGKFVGLMRSIAVRGDVRGQGIAAKLFAAAENHACSMGLREVYALTTTIADWLTRLGFERLQREDAPDELRQTQEFSGLCPASAVIMRKTLRVPSERLPHTFECA